MVISIQSRSLGLMLGMLIIVPASYASASKGGSIPTPSTVSSPAPTLPGLSNPAGGATGAGGSSSAGLSQPSALPASSAPMFSTPGTSGPLPVSEPHLRSTTSTELLKPPIEAGNVESFFEVGPSSPSTGNRVTAERLEEGGATKSLLHNSGKLVWHLLDNLGVPMFIGKDNDLDPSISRNYLLSMPKVSDQTKTLNISPHKIPDSELEGVDLPALKDAQTP